MCIRDRNNTRSVMSSIIERSLKHLCNKQNDKVMDLSFNTIENVITEILQYKILSSISRTEIIMDTVVIRTTRVHEVMDHG